METLDNTQSDTEDKKASRAFRTIAEVSDDLNVPQHVLRFWEKKFDEVAPVQRGGGRRYYRPEDISLLKKIEFLLYKEGYTIKGVQKLLKEGRINAVIDGNGGEGKISVSEAQEDGAADYTINGASLDALISELEEIGDLLKKAV